MCPLTERELQILQLLVDGRTNGEIARQLHIKERTVKGHLTDIFTTLDVDTRTKAAVLALRLGMSR
jgi:DNA-binding NarL/FixJ family response regulator